MKNLGQAYEPGKATVRVDSTSRKAQRRREAEERNADWAKLTPQQQLAHLDKLKLGAIKQRKRLEKKLANV